MIIDAHVHAFPGAIREDRDRFFDGEDAFRSLYDSSKSELVGAGDIVRAMDEDGVDRSVVFGFPWKRADHFRRSNDYILEAVSRYPERLVGLCCMDPAHPEALEETQRCLDAGMSGVGELAFYEGGISEAGLDALAPIMDLCRQRDLPVMIHTNEPVGHVYPGKSPNTLAQIYALAGRFRDNRIILAHWGGGIFFYSLMKKEVREVLGNIWFDTAASPYLYDSRVYRVAIDLVGKEKLLFGSDFPLLGARRYFEEMRVAGLSAEEMAAVCGENAARLFGLRG